MRFGDVGDALITCAVRMNDVDLPFTVSHGAIRDPSAVGRQGWPSATGVHRHLGRGGCRETRKQSGDEAKRTHFCFSRFASLLTSEDERLRAQARAIANLL